ncbi:MAG: type II secretion system protein GspF, partial [Proteobacteria bacterium]
MSATALARFTQQLATLLGAGQDLQRALGAVLKQTTDVRQRALVETLRQQVKAGRPFSSVLEEQGRQFPTLYTALVRAGEAGGTLQETLSQLTDYLERSEKLRGEVINALIYPAFLIVGVLGSLVLLLTYVVPQFVPIFRDLNVPLPLITEVILALGQGLAAHALALGAAVPLLAAAVTLSLRDPQRRVRIDARLLRGKVLGGLLQRIEVARLTRTLGTLLSNGVGLLQALVITQQVCGNRALRSQLASVTEAVKGGSTLVNGFG